MGRPARDIPLAQCKYNIEEREGALCRRCSGLMAQLCENVMKLVFRRRGNDLVVLIYGSLRVPATLWIAGKTCLLQWLIQEDMMDDAIPMLRHLSESGETYRTTHISGHSHIRKGGEVCKDSVGTARTTKDTNLVITQVRWLTR